MLTPHAIVIMSAAHEWYFGAGKHAREDASETLDVEFTVIDFGGNVLSFSMPQRTYQVQVDSRVATLRSLQEKLADLTDDPDVYFYELDDPTFPLTPQEVQNADVQNPAHVEWQSRFDAMLSETVARGETGEERRAAFMSQAARDLKNKWLEENPEPPRYLVSDEEAYARMQALRNKMDIIGYQDGRYFDTPLVEIDPTKFKNGQTVRFFAKINTNFLTQTKDKWQKARIRGLKNREWPVCHNFDDVDVINQNGFKLENTEGFRRGNISDYSSRTNLPEYVTVLRMENAAGEVIKTCVNRQNLMKWLERKRPIERFKNPVTQMESDMTNDDVYMALQAQENKGLDYQVLNC